MNLGLSLGEYVQKNDRSNRDSEIVFREVKNLGSSCTCKLKVNDTTGYVRKETAAYRKLWNNSYRFQLEQDVQQLQQLLEEEMQLHVVLENAMDHVSVELAGLSCIPNDAGELLSNIDSLENNVTMLEEEIVSLHFQLIQERNERRLAEYRQKQLPSQSQICSPGNVGAHGTERESSLVLDQTIK